MVPLTSLPYKYGLAFLIPAGSWHRGLHCLAPPTRLFTHVFSDTTDCGWEGGSKKQSLIYPVSETDRDILYASVLQATDEDMSKGPGL